MKAEYIYGSWEVKKECDSKMSAEKCCCRKKSVIKHTNNEPVVGRDIFHRVRAWSGAELTPWLWTGGTREVRAWR